MKMYGWSAGGRWLLVAGFANMLVACGGTDEGDAPASGAEAGSGSRVADEIAPGIAPVEPDRGATHTPAAEGDLMGRMLDEMERLTAVLEDVKDVESARAAASYIVGYSERHGALADQFAALSVAEQAAQSRPHMNRNMEVQMALQQQMMRIGMDPALKPVMDEAFQSLNRK